MRHWAWINRLWWLVVLPWALIIALLLWVAPVWAGHEEVGVPITMQVTAYCYYPKAPLKCDHKPGKHKGVTATGKKVKLGMCAADWAYLPPGSIVLIPGYGLCVIEDRGVDVVGWTVDVFLGSPKEAKEWGRQTLDVTLLQWGR